MQPISKRSQSYPFWIWKPLLLTNGEKTICGLNQFFCRCHFGHNCGAGNFLFLLRLIFIWRVRIVNVFYPGMLSIIPAGSSPSPRSSHRSNCRRQRNDASDAPRFHHGMANLNSNQLPRENLPGKRRLIFVRDRVVVWNGRFCIHWKFAVLAKASKSSNLELFCCRGWSAAIIFGAYRGSMVNLEF